MLALFLVVQTPVLVGFAGMFVEEEPVELLG